MGTPIQFSANMTKRSMFIMLGVNELIRVLVRDIQREEALATPVDTGEARSNWTVNLGSPTRRNIAPYHPYPKYSKALGQERAERANLVGVLLQGASVIPGRAPGQTVYIENNAPHIGILNSSRTTSQQSPPGFVMDAIRIALRKLNGRLIRFVGP